MGLYQLAGPFPFKRDNDTYITGLGDGLWWPHVGLFFPTITVALVDGGILGPAIVSIDGIACTISGFFFSLGAKQNLWPDKNLMVGISGGFSAGAYRGTEKTWESKVLIEGYTPDQQEVWPDDLFFRTWIKQTDRRIIFGGNDVYEHRNGDENLTLLASNVLPFTPQSTMPGRHLREVMFPQHGANADPGAVFFDTDTLEVSKKYYIGEAYYFRHLYYIPEWKVFLTIHQAEDEEWTFEFKIWSMEVRPTIVTDPEVVEGTLRAGQVVTFRVQVTGDQDDPAEDELVEWELTGDVGLLLDPQSKTDADGYATARVKIDVGETGDLDIEARVQC